MVWLVASAVLFVVLGAVALRKQGLRGVKSICFATCIALAGFVGASLLSWLLHPSVPPNGWALDGALLLGGATAFALTRSLRALDVLAPVVGLSLAAARIACVVKGCCGGIVTDVSWAMSTSIGPLLPDIKTHPTQVYEMAAALAGAVIAWRMSKACKPGIGAFFFAFWLSMFRLLNSLFRIPDTDAVLDARWISPAIAAASAICLVMLLRQAKYNPADELHPTGLARWPVR